MIAIAHLLLPFGHDAKESHCTTNQGRHVEILLSSAHQGLHDNDFPDHRIKPCDPNNDDNLMLQIFRRQGISFGPLEQNSHSDFQGCSVSLEEIPCFGLHLNVFDSNWTSLHSIKFNSIVDSLRCAKQLPALPKINLNLPVWAFLNHP